MTLEELKKAVSEQIIVKKSYDPWMKSIAIKAQVDMLEWFQRMLKEVEK